MEEDDLFKGLIDDPVADESLTEDSLFEGLVDGTVMAPAQPEQESTVQEIGEGVASGLLAIPQGILELGGSVVDLAADTNYAQEVTDFFEGIRAAAGIDPEGAAGEITEVLTQFVVPGLVAAGLVSKLGRVKNMTNLARKASQVGAAGVTDAVVSTAGNTTIGDFFESGPTQTTDLIGLEGREAAAARIGNKLKLGFEAAGATALIDPVLKTLGWTGQKAAQIAAKPEFVRAGARAILDSGTALSTKGGEFAAKLLGEDNLEAVKSVFRARGNLPQDVFEVKSAIGGKVQAEATRAARILNDLRKNMNKAYKGVEEVMVNGTALNRADLNNNLYSYLTGEVTEEVLPDFIKTEAKAMRNQVDDLSNRVLASDYLSSAEAGEIVDTIKGNIGSYLRRKYKFFEDAGYKETAEFKQAKEDTVKLFEQDPSTYKAFHKDLYGGKDAMPLDEKAFIGGRVEDDFASATGIKRDYAEKLAEDFLAVAGKKKTKHGTLKGASRTVVDKLRTDMFRQRKTSNDTIRRLLGEIKDPQEAYLSTVADLATFSATDDFLGYLRTQARDTGDMLTKEAYEALPKQLKDEYVQLTATKDGGEDYWGTASGMAVTPRMYKDLTRFVVGDVGVMGNLALGTYSNFLRAKGITQLTKTVFSPITQVRNVTSASMFAMAQGNVGSGANLFESMNIVLDSIAKRGDKLDYYTKLQSLGVIGNQSQLKELDRLMQEGLGVTRDADEVVAGVRVGKQTGNKLTQSTPAQFLMKANNKARAYYQGGDDIWKIYNFEFERNKLLSAFGSEKKAVEALNLKPGQTLDDYAADIVKNTVPNYERVPAVVKGLRKLPFGNFIAFPAEILRTSANTLKQALDEVASTNVGVREIGMRRLTGLLSTTMVVPAALQKTAMHLTGVDDEQLDAARRSAAPWSRNSRLIPTSVDKDGNLKGYIDYSYTNPYDYLQRPVQAIFNAVKDGKEIDRDTSKIAADAVLDAVSEMMAPFGDESMLTERLLDVTRGGGRTKTGAKVYRDVDEAGTKVYKSLFHVAEAFNPGVSPVTLKAQTKATQTGGIESGRFIRGLLGDKLVSSTDPAGNERLAATELIRALTGVTEIEVKPDNIAMYASFDYSGNITGARQIFNTAVKTRGDLSSDDAVAVYRDANEALLRVQNNMYRTVQDMKALGMSDSEVRRALKKYKIGNVSDLMRGKFVPMQISSETKKQVRENGNKLPLSELRQVAREFKNIELGAEEEETPVSVSAPVDQTEDALFEGLLDDVAPVSQAPASATSNLGTLPAASGQSSAGTRTNPAFLSSGNPVDTLKNLAIAQRNP